MQLPAPRHQRQLTSKPGQPRGCNLLFIDLQPQASSSHSSRALVRCHSSLLPTDIIVHFRFVPSFLLFSRSKVCVVSFFCSLFISSCGTRQQELGILVWVFSICFFCSFPLCSSMSCQKELRSFGCVSLLSFFPVYVAVELIDRPMTGCGWYLFFCLLPVPPSRH